MGGCLPSSNETRLRRVSLDLCVPSRCPSSSTPQVRRRKVLGRREEYDTILWVVDKVKGGEEESGTE